MNSIRNQALNLSNKLYFNGYEQMSRDVDGILNAYNRKDKFFLETLPVLLSYYNDIVDEEDTQAVRVIDSIIKLFRENPSSTAP